MFVLIFVFVDADRTEFMNCSIDSTEAVTEIEPFDDAVLSV